jgi:hypothetical protein
MGRVGVVGSVRSGFDYDARRRRRRERQRAITAELLRWEAASFAESWFHDALREARCAPRCDGVNDSILDYRRREIVFSAGLAETYIVEWLRDEVFKRVYAKLGAFFRRARMPNLREKWETKFVDPIFEKNGKPPPCFGDDSEWEKFVSMRNGLIHAKASRAKSRVQPKERNPEPHYRDLEQLKPGWALKLVVDRIRKLHDAWGTAPPAWLRDP